MGQIIPQRAIFVITVAEIVRAAVFSCLQSADTTRPNVIPAQFCNDNNKNIHMIGPREGRSNHIIIIDRTIIPCKIIVEILMIACAINICLEFIPETHWRSNMPSFRSRINTNAVKLPIIRTAFKTVLGASSSDPNGFVHMNVP